MRSLGGMAVGIAGLVFAGSVVAFGATVVDAVLVKEVPIPSEPASTAESDSGVAGDRQGSLQGVIYPRVTNNEILDAVNQDIFQPDRTPSLERYLLPSERDASVQNSRDNRRQREPNLRIVGTAIAGDMAIALVQLDDSLPFMVLLGEVVDGFVVAAVYEESVTLTGDGAEFTFAVVEPQRGSSSDNQDRNTRNEASTQAAARALNERVQQMLQQGMGRGQMPTRGVRPGGGGGGESFP
jgi:hypothetical protein